MEAFGSLEEFGGGLDLVEDAGVDEDGDGLEEGGGGTEVHRKRVLWE